MSEPYTPQPGTKPGSWTKGIGYDEYLIRLGCGCVAVHYYTKKRAKTDLPLIAKNAKFIKCYKCAGGAR